MAIKVGCQLSIYLRKYYLLNDTVNFNSYNPSSGRADCIEVGAQYEDTNQLNSLQLHSLFLCFFPSAFTNIVNVLGGHFITLNIAAFHW